MRRLTIRPGAIGDFIVSLPALECLQSDYHEVWAASANVPLVRFADRVRSIASTGVDLLAVSEPPPMLIDALRGFDSIVSWYGTNNPEFRRVVEELGLPFRSLSALPGGSRHAVDFYNAQARQSGAEPLSRFPRMAKCWPQPEKATSLVSSCGTCRMVDF